MYNNIIMIISNYVHEFLNGTNSSFILKFSA